MTNRSTTVALTYLPGVSIETLESQSLPAFWQFCLQNLPTGSTRSAENFAPKPAFRLKLHTNILKWRKIGFIISVQ